MSWKLKIVVSLLLASVIADFGSYLTSILIDGLFALMIVFVLIIMKDEK